MTRDDADTIALRIASSWPTGRIAGDVWVEELLGLDVDIAERTVLRLRRSDDKMPSVARFLDMYAATRRAAQLAGTERGPRDDDYVTLAEGIRIARDAYEFECAMQGRAPSWNHFDTIIARLRARGEDLEEF
jgi:hypothetical protein